MVVRTNVLKSESYSYAEYSISCITYEDAMSKQHIVANCTSQQSLHILDVPASWALLCSGPDLWFEEDFARIFLDIETQKHKQIPVIASQGSFARHCILYCCTLRSGHLHHPWNDVFRIQRVPSFDLAS